MAIGIGAEITELRRRQAEFIDLLNKALQPYRMGR
jgi:hypothetical protein